SRHVEHIFANVAVDPAVNIRTPYPVSGSAINPELLIFVLPCAVPVRVTKKAISEIETADESFLLPTAVHVIENLLDIPRRKTVNSHTDVAIRLKVLSLVVFR